MVISNIIPRYTMRNRMRQQSMAERNEYDQKDERHENGELVSSYMCSPETAAEEFEISKVSINEQIHKMHKIGSY